MDLAVSLLSPLLTIFDKLETTVSKFFQRKDLTEDNVEQLHRLKRQFADARELVPKIEPRVAHDAVLHTRLHQFEKTLDEDVHTINKLQNKIDRATPMDRVRRMKEVLDRCEDHVKEFFEFMTSNLPPMPEPEYGRYIPRNTVPVNPPRLTLDYEDPDTYEGRLRATVIDQSAGRVVALVASGKGGVGKTCALRGLADDEKVRNVFSGGTLYIQLGHDAALSDIVQSLANIVKRTGSPRLAEKIRTSRTLKEASEKASDWFLGQSCLFLVDDIWRVNGIDSDVFNILGSMVNKRSRLIYTTRDKHFLDPGHESIEFEEREVHGDVARRMLLKHGGFDEAAELEEQNKQAFEAILHECQGLPLAFGIAGGAVLKKSRRRMKCRKQDAWSDLHNEMISKADRSTFLESSAEQYGGLNRMADLSLQVLDAQHEDGKYHKLFRALCVLRKQQRVPLQMLKKLWDVGSLEETEEVAEVLDGVSLVQMQEDNGVTYIQLHDLVLDIVKNDAVRRCETQSFLRTLIGNYFLSSRSSNGAAMEVHDDEQPGRNIEGEHVEEATESNEASQVMDEATKTAAPEPVDSEALFSHAWWSVDDDGYIHNNLCSLLRNAGYGKELLRLLSQPQWIVMRLLQAGIYNLEQDLEEGKSLLTNNTSFQSDHKEHLEMVGKAARMSCTFVGQNHREVWFQLHGRLLLHATQNERTREFVEKIERVAPKPWIKASIGLLQQAVNVAPEVIRGRGRVLCANLEQESLWFIWGESDKMGVSRYDLSTGSYKTVNLAVESILDAGFVPECSAFMPEQNSIITAHSNGMIYMWSRVTGELEGALECRRNRRWAVSKFDCRRRRAFLSCFGTHDDDMEDFFVEFSADGRIVASTCEHHTIRLWDTLSGEAVGQPLRGHTDSVMCVAVSPDGSRVVSGSDDKTVRVWDTRSGETVGQPLRGHTGSVWCLAVNPDCSRIVSGSEDQTVRVWDTLSGEAVGQPLGGLIGSVNCLAVTRDESRIVSGSADRTVRVWEARTGEAVGEPLRGHTAYIQCVAVSPDGTRIASGSWDETVRVWPARRGEAARRPLRGHTLSGHTLSVICVAVSPDGTRIASGSLDETVRVWDARSGEAVGQPLCGHTGSVMCVTLSCDGCRIVSGSLDKTVRIWDTRSGKAVVQSLRGHTSGVYCVAANPGFSRVASGSGDQTVRFWDARSGEALGQPFRGHTCGVTSVALSPDGSRIISGSSDETVRLWDVQSGEAVGLPLRGHSSEVKCVAMSPDGRRIVSGSFDMTLRVWDTSSGEVVGVALEHEQEVIAVGVDANCSRIASWEWNGVGRLWDTRRGECVLTSEDASWQSTVGALSLSWSSGQEFSPVEPRVTARADDGSVLLLATCEDAVANVNGGDVYWSRTFGSCRIERGN